MTINDIVGYVQGFLEQRAQKFDIQNWTNEEISELIHRQRYWWRKKQWKQNTNSGNPQYQVPADFEQFINLYNLNPPAQQPAISEASIAYMHDNDQIQTSLNVPGSGPPQRYFWLPGNQTTLVLLPTPDSTYQLSGLYWAGYVWATDPSQPIPLIPSTFHYVALLASLKIALFYVFGQNDPRYAVAEKKLEIAMKKLDEHIDFSSEPQAIRPPWIPHPWPTREEIVPVPRNLGTLRD
jgi:hypothetical protein